MSNLFKSKFLVGVMVVAFVFVVAGLGNAKTSAASTCTITSTLKVGSKGTEVVCLQTALGGLTADGNFGAKTKAAVMAWQTKEGLVADGVFGAKSRAQWEENAGNSANFPAGCTSTVGFSLTTGQSCATTVGAFPAGCTSALGFSPTTGGSCATTVTLVPGCNSYVGFSPTTGASCATGVTSNQPTNPNAAGNVSADGILGGFANTIVGVGDQNHQVAGFQLTGAGGGSNLNLTSATVQLLETNTASGRLNDYFSAVSLMQNGVVIGSVPASAFSSNTLSGINNYVYSASIPLTNAKVLAGQQNNFYVAVTANNSMDSGNYAANAWAVQVNNIRFTDGTGTTLVYNPISIGAPLVNSTVTTANSAYPNQVYFSFGSAATANNIVVNIARSSSDINAHTVTVNQTGSSTPKVPLLAIDLSVQGGQTVSINKLPITLTAATPAGVSMNVGALTNEVYLMAGNVVLDSEAVASTATSPLNNVTFKINPSSPLLVNSRQTVTIAADINSVIGGAYTAGSSLIAATQPASTLYDISSGTPNGSELVNSTSGTINQLIPGTANGQQVAFFSTGASVALTSETCTPSNSTTTGAHSTLSCTINYSVTANSSPVYIPQATAVTGTTSTSAVVFNSAKSGVSQPLSQGTPVLSASFSQVGSNATASQGTNEWTINSGVTATFTANVVIDDTASAFPGQYRSYLVGVPWATTTQVGAATYPNFYNFNLGTVNTLVPGYTQIN